MEKLSVLFIFALVTSTLGTSLRDKRQAQDDNNLEDRYGFDRPRQWFPGTGGRWPNQGPRPWDPNNGNSNNGNGNNGNDNGNGNGNGNNNGNGNGSLSTTEATAAQNCIRSCPVTSEYNPVCGTNSITYPNPGRLACAQACGVSVSLLRSSPCSTTTTTSAPN